MIFQQLDGDVAVGQQLHVVVSLRAGMVQEPSFLTLAAHEVRRLEIEIGSGEDSRSSAASNK